MCACGFGVLSLAREQMAAEKLTVMVELIYFSLNAVRTLSLFVTVSFSRRTNLDISLPLSSYSKPAFFLINLCG